MAEKKILLGYLIKPITNIVLDYCVGEYAAIMVVNFNDQLSHITFINTYYNNEEIKQLHEYIRGVASFEEINIEFDPNKLVNDEVVNQLLKLNLFETHHKYYKIDEKLDMSELNLYEDSPPELVNAMAEMFT